MIERIILVIILSISSAQASTTCYELANIGETIMKSRQDGMPEFIIKKTLEFSGIKTNAMKHFTAQLIMDAYAIPKVHKEDKEEVIKQFGNSLYKDCYKLITLHNKLK
jgi:hypothetical protein